MKLIRAMLKKIGLAALIAALANGASAQSLTEIKRVPVGPFEGVPKVVDADTLKFGTVNVRLFGIDAPEKGQCCIKPNGEKASCGAIAKDILIKYLAGKAVHCDITMIDTRWKRPVGVCRMVGSGLDLNAMIVSAGMAVAAPRYTADYVDEEAEARKTQRFLWSMQFENPKEWRARKQADSSSVEICKAPKS